LLKAVHPEGIPWVGAALYNRVSATRVFQRQYALIARDILSYCSEGNLLDIGTGPGWLLVHLHRLSPGLQGTGIDASPAMVARARKNIAAAGLSGRIEVRDGKASQLPFAAGVFDAVVSTASMHHWKDPTAGLQEAYRVLKPGGYALMYDLVSDTPASVLAEMAREWGKLKRLFLWLHAFEEPFYRQGEFALLARPTLFQEGRTRFVGVLCCLALKKGTKGI
jgi:ubiquinone/menaquinone biosynthesis C-methylase UbiE